MPIIKSAKKRVKVAAKATARNKRTKRNLREAVKTFISKSTSSNQNNAQSAIDTAVKKGVIHKNKAARQKRRLSAIAKSSGAKTVAKKPTTKKAPAKKPATKKK